MDVRDGFIVGIYNYCDSWCERCAFTSYCRLFADAAEADASLDPNLKAIAAAPPLPEEAPPPPPLWLQEIVEEMNAAAREPMSAEEWERIRPRVPAEHTAIVARAQAYADRVREWLEPRRVGEHDAPDDPRAVISWFHTLIEVKIKRALTVWPGDPDASVASFDADGSAKVALIGIDRSHAAWLQLVERGVRSAAEADSFIADLVWLGDALERVRPRARAFVRPAFDEPGEVAKLINAGTACDL